MRRREQKSFAFYFNCLKNRLTKQKDESLTTAMLIIAEPEYEKTIYSSQGDQYTIQSNIPFKEED